MKVLILGGGGTLGAFSAGALRALVGAGWTPDACIGSSAGSINLLRYLTGGPDAAVDFWLSLDWRRLLAEGLTTGLLREGILDPVRFHARVDEGVDYARVRSDPRPLSFIVVDLGTGRVGVRGNRTEKSTDALRAVAHASYCLPPLLPPVPFGGCLLADGGLLQNAPLEAALRMGATEIVYLCNVQVLPREQDPNWTAQRATRRYVEIFFRRASNVGFADANVSGGRYHGVPFLTVAPPLDLPLHSIFRTFLPNARSLEQLVRHGEMRAREALQLAGAHDGRRHAGEIMRPTFATTGVGR